MKNPILVIAGPTASGKTEMAVKLAKEFDGEIINADSRSIYIGMDLGTGKPIFDKNVENNSKFEIRNSKLVEDTPHHLFDLVTPDQNFNFVQYKELAKKKIEEIQTKGKIPFIVGGTGLYIDAVIYDFEPAGKADWKFRQEMESKSADELHQLLTKLDPETAVTIDPKNKRRIIRALEILSQTGKGKISQEQKKQKPKNVLYLAIETDREELYKKINQRVDKWLNQDFEAEVKKLLERYSLDSPGMNGIGYKQIGLYLTGKISKQEAIEKFKQGDRNLAKRQITWLKRNSDVIWVKNATEAEKEIRKFLLGGK